MEKMYFPIIEYVMDGLLGFLREDELQSLESSEMNEYI